MGDQSDDMAVPLAAGPGEVLYTFQSKEYVLIGGVSTPRSVNGLLSSTSQSCLVVV